MEKLKPCPFCGEKVIVYYTSLIGCCVMEHNIDRRKKPINRCILSGSPIVIDGAKTLREAYEKWNRRTKTETNLYDEVEEIPNCTVQILRNSVTGEESVGWWKNE